MEVLFFFRVCVCVCMRTLSKSIFVCFATSPDIQFGATDRKAVKCDLNILCLHLFPPFSSPSLFLVLPHFPLISLSSLSITISLGASVFPCICCPPPLPSEIISLSPHAVSVHIIRPFGVFHFLQYHLPAAHILYVLRAATRVCTVERLLFPDPVTRRLLSRPVASISSYQSELHV